MRIGGSKINRDGRGEWKGVNKKIGDRGGGK